MRSSALALVVALACDSAPPLQYYVRDGFLRDVEGRALILHGANVSGKNKWAPYLDFQQQPDITRMRDEWGMNLMRLLTVWAAIEPERGVFDANYLAALDERVSWAEAAGILVIVDMHEDLYGEGFTGGDGAPKWTCDASHYAAFTPTTPWFFGNLDPNVEACVDGLYHDEALITEFASAWQHVATQLMHHPNVIGFDPLNEPGWGTASIGGYEADVLAPFYERVVVAVREVAPQWVAFIEPGASRNLGYPTQLPLPDYPNVVYAPHSYDATAEQGMAFDPTHRAAILANTAALASEAQALGAALWVGEYGGPGSLPGISDYLGDELDGFGMVGASAMYWEYGEDDGYGLLALDGSEKAKIVSVVTRPYPERVAGDTITYAWDSTTRSLTVTYKPNREIHSPTLISVPPAFQPVTVTCEGCTFDFEPPGVRLLTPPVTGIATVVVHSD